MLQVVQHLKTGKLYVDHLPAPALKGGGVLVQNRYSLVSGGTERLSVETAQSNLIEKARKRPDLVRQVVQNIQREGLWRTYEKVKTRLDTVKPLGYSCAGVVLESSCDEFQPGDRVACGGTGYASHAEIVFVPRNLTAKVPENVALDAAAFTTLGAVAVQGARQADVRVGESVVVIGLGLVGLVAVQVFKASGCFVVGLDVDPERLALAESLGCDLVLPSGLESVDAVVSATGGLGADAVLIAAATTSNEPLELALEMARKKGRVVVLGNVKMDVPRSPFYEKELELTISCSYGPGRYDPSYEEGGLDYPAPYVRWTENRNMQTFLYLLSQGKVRVEPLITHRFSIANAVAAYDVILGKTNERSIGVLLEYGSEPVLDRALPVAKASQEPPSGDFHVGFVGAGNFAQAHLLPPLKEMGVSLWSVATSTPLSAKTAASKFGFRHMTTDALALIRDPNVKAVFIATRHDSHARYVVEALRAGKLVYVEKPLAVDAEQLEAIVQAVAETGNRALMVGFNRRFSEPFRHIKEFFRACREPLVIHYRVNAGFLPKDHWYQGPEQGGRIVGEGCHFVDCLQFLTGSRVVRVYAECLGSDNARYVNRDNVAITLRFADGSVGVIEYLGNGDRSLPKERCEVFGGGMVAVMDDFWKLTLAKNGKTKRLRFNGDKGHTAEMRATLEAMRNGSSMPIPFEGLLETTRVTFAVHDSIERGQPIELASSFAE